MDNGGNAMDNNGNMMDNSGKSRKLSAKEYFRSLLDMRSDMLSYEDLHTMMEENTVIHGANMWILMLAILIASIGLNVNSTAVIIGAMLISPLMSGILTMGYSLGIRDLSMLKFAAARFGTQVLISLVTSTVYFMLTPLTTATSEMIARTSPTLWDVLIALFGGIAGSIGNTRKKTSNVVPGVAIATALMPPLCTVGYGIATRQLNFVLGAFHLFLINTLFIALSAFFVTKVLGVPCKEELDAKKQKHVSHIIAAMIVITVVPSALSGAYTVYKSVVDGNISSYLDAEFAFADTQIVQSKVDRIHREISVSLVGAQLSDERISELSGKLSEYGLSGYTLHVLQNRQFEGEDSDKATIAVQENTIRELGEQLESEKNARAALEKERDAQIDAAALAAKTAEVFTGLSDIRIGKISDAGGAETILLLAGAQEPLSGEVREMLENFLKAETGAASVALQIETSAAR